MAASQAQSIEQNASNSEAELIVRLRAGNEMAFEMLVREFGPRMLSVIRRFLPQDADSHDALQDAFLSAFKSIAKFQGDSSLGTWLHRIAVNAALMKIRSRKRHPERPIEDFLPKYVEDGHRDNVRTAWAATADRAVQANETRELVLHSIEKLPESFRTILLLRDIEERTTEETAEILELNISNVKTRLHRARQALRELLDQHFGELQL